MGQGATGVMIMKTSLYAAALAALLASTAATAVTYTSTRTVGAGTVDISITTDDTLGVLSDVNILDYVITLDAGVNSFTLDFGANSDFDISGAGFTATATDLLFDFDAPGYVLFQNPGPGSGGPFYCLQGVSACFDFDGPGEGFDPVAAVIGQVEVTRYSGVQVIASVGDAVVPEPASWVLMIAGFGMIGGALRRRSDPTARFAA